MARTDPSVNPLVPLSLLEAVRDADRPEGAEEAEYVPELLNKRLGQTDTVYTQIRRYTDAVRRGQPIPRDEVGALARLIARRPDAVTVFAAAGARAAEAAYERLSGTMRALVRYLPGFVARPLARRQARKLLARYFDVTLRRTGTALAIDVPREAPLANPGGDVGRAFYDAALARLLSLLGLLPAPSALPAATGPASVETTPVEAPAAAASIADPSTPAATSSPEQEHVHDLG